MTGGPYRWIRHPLYTINSLMNVGIGIATANGFILGFALAVLFPRLGARLDR